MKNLITSGTKVTRMQRKNVKNRIGNVIGNALFHVHLLLHSIYCIKQKEKPQYIVVCGALTGNRTQS